MTILFRSKLHGSIKAIKIFKHDTNENFVNYILRYGEIIKDISYECDKGYYKGFNRTREVFIDGILCTVRMNNGKILECGYGTCDKYDRDRITEHFANKR